MVKLFILAGAISILISGIFIGAWTGGQRERGHFHSETNEHRKFRTRIGMIFGVIGLLFLAAAGMAYIL
ncbi:DUF5316 family protein [Bacillus massiliglaciei]|uniref:DUF5316 family protein n=1 Tax=Bacillus massiliglaciei TaxID=1816693 RepID=UPI000DA63555|nr:DUF5316 family protein [Bacillus massiliglaciei]